MLISHFRTTRCHAHYRECVAADSIINFKLHWPVLFINHGNTYWSFHIIPTAVTTLAEQVANMLPQFSVLAGALVNPVNAQFLLFLHGSLRDRASEILYTYSTKQSVTFKKIVANANNANAIWQSGYANEWRTPPQAQCLARLQTRRLLQILNGWMMDGWMI